jgi:hypothetical protein
MTPKALQKAQAKFDRRLLESALKFGNGEGLEELFAWVPGELQRLAEPVCTPQDLKKAAFKWSDGGFDAQYLRWQFRVCLGRFRRLEPRDDDLYNGQLSALEMVTKYRLVDGRLLKVAVPVVNSVARCISYAIHLYMSDAHGLRAAVKECPFVADPLDSMDEEAPWGLILNPTTDENIRRIPHWFLQLPITKRRFCCEQHSAAFRQRIKRARDARKPK